MKLAILGAGAVGMALAHALCEQEHVVTLGVRDPEKVRAQGLPPATECASMVEAVRNAELVVLALPFTALEGLLPTLDLTGRVVLDATNPLRLSEEGLELSCGFDISGAEKIAAWSPGSSVVKGLNQVGAEVLQSAVSSSIAPVMYLAGDDEESLELARGLTRDLGFEPRLLPELRLARLLEPLAMLWIHQAITLQRGRDFALLEAAVGANGD